MADPNIPTLPLACKPSMLIGDALATLDYFPDGYFQTCITSPPYFGLRDYGVDGQMGLEATPDEYVAALAAERWAL